MIKHSFVKLVEALKQGKFSKEYTFYNILNKTVSLK
jgi:hypothetical protein